MKAKAVPMQDKDIRASPEERVSGFISGKLYAAKGKTRILAAKSCPAGKRVKGTAWGLFLVRTKEIE